MSCQSFTGNQILRESAAALDEPLLSLWDSTAYQCIPPLERVSSSTFGTTISNRFRDRTDVRSTPSGNHGCVLLAEELIAFLDQMQEKQVDGGACHVTSSPRFPFAATAT